MPEMMKDKPEVLFVCVHNAGRSQMAAALLDHKAQGRVSVRSAGSTPADEINPVVVDAMAELGIDISKEFPKKLSDEVVRDSDVVVTMGCGDACPVFPGKRYLDWDLTDPSGKDIKEVRAIRDEISARIDELLASLTEVASWRSFSLVGFRSGFERRSACGAAPRATAPCCSSG